MLHVRDAMGIPHLTGIDTPRVQPGRVIIVEWSGPDLRDLLSALAVHIHVRITTLLSRKTIVDVLNSARRRSIGEGYVVGHDDSRMWKNRILGVGQVSLEVVERSLETEKPENSEKMRGFRGGSRLRMNPSWSWSGGRVVE